MIMMARDVLTISFMSTIPTQNFQYYYELGTLLRDCFITLQQFDILIAAAWEKDP